MKKEKVLEIIKYVLFFSFLYLFFTRVCPIVPYEGDDWFFLGSMRQPIPYPGAFNPSKILPEVLEPLCGYFGAFVIYPITHDYVDSLSMACTGCISLFIVMLFYLFNRMLKKRYKFDNKKSLLYELLFIILFFVFFKKENQNSFYGFWSKSLNCYFNYLIPAIINGAVVLFMMGYENFQESFNKKSNFSKGFFIVIVYFTLFSSIQLNVILPTYVFACFLKEFIKLIKAKGKFKTKLVNIIKSTWIYILILVGWLVSIGFDLAGRRGKMMANEHWLSLDNLKLTANTLNFTYSLMFKPLLWVLCIGLVLLIIYSIKHRKEKLGIVKNLLYILLVLFLNVAYIILLYMNAGYGYAYRIDATWGILFYLILLIMAIIIMCNKYIKVTEVTVPIMIVLFFVVSANLNYPFAQSIFDAKAAKEIDNYIINQILEADKEGKSSTTVKVPKHADDSKTNWPHPYNMAQWLQNGLYAHRLTRNRFYIVFEPDEKVTKELYTKDYSNMFFFDFERDKFLK